MDGPDYYDIANSIIEIIGKTSKPLTEQQKLGLTGALSIWLKVRDDRIETLEKALDEAIEDISHWGGYASEYFQEKHDLAGCLSKHRKTLGLMERST